MKKLGFRNREEWRLWLDKNHNRENELWLIFQKKDSSKPSVSYDEAVEEALCYGWIDSIIRTIDDRQYMRKFTPRKETSVWSASNRIRVEKLIREKRMTRFGLRLVNAAKENGRWDQPAQLPEVSLEVHTEFREAMDLTPEAKRCFQQLAASHKKEYIVWINMAKRDDTRSRRIKEAVELLARGDKLGLK